MRDFEIHLGQIKQWRGAGLHGAISVFNDLREPIPDGKAFNAGFGESMSENNFLRRVR